VNEAIRIRRSVESGKDETMYAVVKKQEMVVQQGTKHLAETVSGVGQQVQDSLSRHDITISDFAERLAAVERHTARQSAAINRLLEISIVCYGILRHYVLGLFVVRLTKQTFQQYAEGFSKRLDVFRKSVRSGNLLLEGDYELMAEEFAQGLASATTVVMPGSDEEQARAQRTASPVTTGSALTVPPSFPQT
jgi:hypothetical protein